MSRLEGCRRWDEAGLWEGVRGGEDIVSGFNVVSKSEVEMMGASELGKV